MIPAVMTSCAGGDDSGFDSDDDSDCGSEDADAGADALLPAPPLSLRESQRKRRSNLPEFKMFSDDQEQEPPPSRAKDLNRNPVALTREELGHGLEDLGSLELIECALGPDQIKYFECILKGIEFIGELKYSHDLLGQAVVGNP